MGAPTIAECRELLGKKAEQMTDAEVQALADELLAGARVLVAVCQDRQAAAGKL